MSKSKYLDLAGLTVYDGKLKEWFKAGVVDITDDAIRELFVTVAEGPADNEIWYTSSDGNIVNPNKTDVFGANIVSNTYEDGKGVITFDGEVTTIGNGAFFECYYLTSVVLPNSVTSIGNQAFWYCIGLTSVTIPNSVTGIGVSAFAYCSGLTSITIPNSVTSIGTYAFVGCSSLTSIIIPNSVTSIGDWAFSNCSGLTSITIPNSVTRIGESAFDGCSGLTSITIPNSITTIGYKAFRNCSGLTSITYEGTQEQWNNIYKGKGWKSNVPATHVQCSDGQVLL
jgi:hypothetical protein